MQNPPRKEETHPHPLPISPQASCPQLFSALVAETRCKLVQNWMIIASQATKKMNQTLTDTSENDSNSGDSDNVV